MLYLLDTPKGEGARAEHIETGRNGKVPNGLKRAGPGQGKHVARVCTLLRMYF